MNGTIAKWLIIAGVILILAGIIFYFLSDKLKWIGHLPGDIYIEKENFKFYYPLTTGILASLALTVVYRLIKRFFG